MTAKALKWRSALLQWFGVEKRSQRCHRALSYETSELLGFQFGVRFCDVFAALCGFEWLLPQIFQVAQANSRLHPSWVSSQYLWVSTANLSNVAKQHIQLTHERPLYNRCSELCQDMHGHVNYCRYVGPVWCTLHLYIYNYIYIASLQGKETV